MESGTAYLCPGPVLGLAPTSPARRRGGRRAGPLDDGFPGPARRFGFFFFGFFVRMGAGMELTRFTASFFSSESCFEVGPTLANIYTKRRSQGYIHRVTNTAVVAIAPIVSPSASPAMDRMVTNILRKISGVERVGLVVYGHHFSPRFF